MKKTINLLSAVLLVLAFAACRQTEPQPAFQTLQDSSAFLLTADEQLWPPESDTLGVSNSYCLAWPAEGLLSPEAEQELLLLTFGDSAATSFQQAADAWLATTWFYEEDVPHLHRHPADSVPSRLPSNYGHLHSTATFDSTLILFTISSETGAAFAAHGVYATRYLTADRSTGRTVHLNDLVDTALLGPVIVRAIEDLVVNRPVQESLFDEFRGIPSMPMPDDFFIDSARTCITLVYPLYSIAPYACGIQSIVLPIFWLSKHIPLTPYAKELFGPEAYLPEN
jgi:hypothetical protein